MTQVKNDPGRGTMLLLLILVNIAIVKHAFIADVSWYKALVVTMPLLFLYGLLTKKKQHKTGIPGQDHTTREIIVNHI